MLSLPDVCSEPPAHGQAFCGEHCEFLPQQAPDVPTGLRDFLRFCGTLNDGKYLIVNVYNCLQVEFVDEYGDGIHKSNPTVKK